MPLPQSCWVGEEFRRVLPRERWEVLSEDTMKRGLKFPRRGQWGRNDGRIVVENGSFLRQRRLCEQLTEAANGKKNAENEQFPLGLAATEDVAHDDEFEGVDSRCGRAAGPSFTSPCSSDSPMVIERTARPEPSAPAPAFLQSTGQQVERRWISTLPSNSLQRLLSISRANISHRGLRTCSFSTGSMRRTSHPRVCWWNRQTVRRRGALMVIMIIMMIVMTA